jgi:serine/threonine protein kinase/Flp pilus assembly protein TadD
MSRVRPTASSNIDSGSPSSVLAELIDQVTTRRQANEPIDWDALLREHPERADELRRLRPALDVLDELSRSGSSGAAAAPADEADAVVGTLGEFRLLCEIGRGGMGIVYEAEQLSLGRRVALKVLPLAATMDPRHLQRFQNEARAAASLHHEHIVPVYAVGCERAVHFYAMQFIEGRSLAAVIAAQDSASRAQEPSNAAGGPDTGAVAAASTLAGPRDTAYFRRCAEWGRQAAEALEHAHALGIVHRDIKPANLIVDAQGKLWVTDFGLAQCRDQPGLTMTGDLVGTLRYMAPEQALAQRDLVDHRADVYSLGATLYELLTLQPVFSASNREELLRQVAFEEPTSPRRIDRAIPLDLETIVLKAIAKNPAERYATAQAMADDLGRYLEDKPIAATRPTMVQRARRWCGRHRALVWSAAACAIMAVTAVAGSIGWVTGDQAARRAIAEEKAGLAFDDSLVFQQQDKWFEALSAIQRAEGLLAGDVSGEALERVRRRRLELELVAALDKIQLDSSAALRDGAFDIAPRDAAYMHAFRDHGIDPTTAKTEDAADFIRTRSICPQLAAALDDWAIVCRNTRPKDDTTWRNLLAIARAADPDRLRNQVRDALEKRDQRALEKLAASDQAITLPPSTLLLVVRVLRGIQAAEPGKARDEPAPQPVATRLLRQAQRKHPHDFWLNMELAWHLASARSPQWWAEAIRCYSVARALRPHSALVHVSLSYALLSAGRVDDAVACCEEALRLEPDLAPAHNNLGYALRLQGELDRAIRCYDDAIRLQPRLASAHDNLGNALKEKGQWDRAEKAYREALRLKPGDPRAEHNLAILLHDRGNREEALARFEKIARLKPMDAPAQSNYGATLMGVGRLTEAEAAHRKAIELSPRFAKAHSNLGAVLRRQGRLNEALDAYRAAIEHDPTFAGAYSNLAWILATAPDEKLRDPTAAVTAAQKAVALTSPKEKRELATCWQRLGVSQYRAGDAKAALAALHSSVELGTGADGVDLFFLAMTYWQLGNKDEAGHYYRRALECLARPANEQPRRFYQPLEEEFHRFHREAAQLLGVDG